MVKIIIIIIIDFLHCSFGNSFESKGVVNICVTKGTKDGKRRKAQVRYIQKVLCIHKLVGYCISNLNEGNSFSAGTILKLAELHGIPPLSGVEKQEQTMLSKVL
ncbi:Hypothetical predicted protein [Podarcis lilfordi]|uniref:Uncharacterized protein n=1 Tax=Podarcis lilfordi TaxID=74358 RepID=A0AA35KDH7_9SAUR|nr:Hypothetical predicted protein [Podarcis lilfordi]